MRTPTLMLLIYILSSLYSSFAQAKNYAFFFGGELEQTGAQQGFYESVLEFEKAIARSNEVWETHIHFNGSKEQIGRILEVSDQTQLPLDHFSTSFTYDTSYTEEKEYLKNLINFDQLIPGDKLLFVFSTHGSYRDDNFRIVHAIQAGKNSEDFINLDGLKEILERAPKDVKIGIMDLSCYSGFSLQLATPNTCVISASSKKGFSYTDYYSHLLRTFQPNFNLEEIFLESKKTHTGRSQPEISTSTNQKVNDLLNNLDELQQNFQNNPKIQNRLATLKELKRKQESFQRQIQKISEPWNHIQTSFYVNWSSEPIIMPWPSLIDYVTLVQQSPTILLGDDKGKNLFEKASKEYNNLTKYSNFLALSRQIQSYKSLDFNNHIEIEKTLRTLYVDLYEILQNKSENNPCRDFVF